MNFKYRIATPEDAAECIQLRGKTRENAVSPGRFESIRITVQSWSDDIRTGVLPGHICSTDGKIVGYCFGSLEEGEVVVLAVLPEYEGHGIGRSLLGKVNADLVQAGNLRLFLGCSTDPKSRSYGFYRSLGWCLTGQIDKHGDEILEYYP